MSLEKGFKFKSYFYDSNSISSMTYDELDFLINQVNEEIIEASTYIFPYSDQLKNRDQTLPKDVTNKLRYKDALVYFSKDLKKELNQKRMSIEKAFFKVCSEKMNEQDFAMYFVEAEKISTGV